MPGRASCIGIVVLVFATLFPIASAYADSIEVCYNYGCATRATIDIPDEVIALTTETLRQAESAQEERHALGPAIGQLYAWAATQTPIGVDHWGNYADAGQPGSMDCIDHATTTTHLLDLLDHHGALRFHRVLNPERRGWAFVHYSAKIVALAEPKQQGLQDADHETNSNDTSERYAVDSWYVDNGLPALVLPLEDWKADKIDGKL